MGGEKTREMTKIDRNDKESEEITYMDEPDEKVVLYTARNKKPTRTDFTLGIKDFDRVNDEAGFAPVHRWMVSGQVAPETNKKGRTTGLQSAKVWVVTHWAGLNGPVAFGCCSGELTCAGVFSSKTDAEGFVRKCRSKEEAGRFKSICSEWKEMGTHNPAQMCTREVNKDPNTTVFFLELANMERLNDEVFEGPNHQWFVSAHEVEK